MGSEFNMNLAETELRQTRSRTCLAVFLGLFLFLGLVLPASSQAATEDYAILIVGDEGAAEMLRQEQVLINEMGKHIREQTPEERLPILSYHFNKERERAYCENKLNVLSEDLLFVGIVKLQNKVPQKVVYRVDRINNPSRAAKDILLRAEEVLAEANPDAVKTVPIPQVTPDSPVTPPSSGTTGVDQGFRIQLGSFTQLKHAQDVKAAAARAELEVAVVQSVGAGGSPVFKVLSPLLAARAEADSLLERFHEAGFEEAFLTRVGE